MNTLHFKHWPQGVPHTVCIPETSLFHNLEVAAARYPTRTATNFFGTESSWQSVYAQSLALASWLQNEARVQDGDRVAIYLQNCPQFVVGYYGLVGANAIGVPVNVMLTPDEAAYIVQDSGAKVIITEQSLLSRVLPLLESGAVEHIIVTAYSDAFDAKAPGVAKIPAALIPSMVTDARLALPAANKGKLTSWTEATAFTEPALRAHNRKASDLALLPYTSGTTGRPKGCRLHHSNLQYQCIGANLWNTTTPDNVHLVVAPMFHITGFVLGVCGNTYIGSSMVIMPRWDRELAGVLIEQFKVTHWTNIPTMIIDLLASPNINNFNLRSLTRVGGGGAAMPEAVAKKWGDLTGLPYMEGYGLSETAAPSHYAPTHRPKRQCLGIPFIDVDSRIIDPETLKELPQGESGEIITHGPMVFSGYWNDVEKTAQAFIEIDGKPFFRTGDLARIDEDGYFFMVDRLKRMINASGFKVWPAEVESSMYQHPDIAECCIIAALDGYRGETVKAVVVKRAGSAITGEEITAWAREKMAAYKVPRVVEFVEALPKSGAGKVLWRVLQENERNKEGKKDGAVS